MAKPDLGEKRQCQNCGSKFFDLHKNPIVCPKCGTVFEVVAATRTASRVTKKDDEDEVEAESDAEVVSLEDADQTDDGKVSAAKSDDDGDDDDSDDDDSASNDDDTFLEDDDEDDGDVSGLVDNERDEDEER